MDSNKRQQAPLAPLTIQDTVFAWCRTIQDCKDDVGKIEGPRISKTLLEILRQSHIHLNPITVDLGF